MLFIDPYQVSVLFDGYSYKTDTGSQSNCTCTLIKGPKNIIVDTRTAWDGESIKRALQDHEISCERINYVICTHGHSDHIGCNYLFHNAIHIVGQSVSKGDQYFDHNFQKEPYQIDDNVKVLATPGHTSDDVSVIVFTNNLGVVAITGDLFENEQDLEDSQIWKDAGSANEKLQEENREKILKIADHIIPGHGRLFRNSHKTVVSTITCHPLMINA